MRSMLQRLLLAALLAPVDAEICLIFASMSGTTARIAEYIGYKTGLDPIPIHALEKAAFQACDHYIVGTPTLKAGNPEGKSGTDWDPWLLFELKRMASLEGKMVAVFATGDAVNYAHNFCDAAGELAQAFVKKGAKLVGQGVSQDDYRHANSLFLDEDEDKFIGLPLDEIHQQDMSGERIRNWLDMIRSDGMPLPEAPCDRRRSLQATAIASDEQSWYAQWQQKLSCWLGGLPMPTQQQLGACVGAFGLHLGGRFDAALGRGAGASAAQGGATAERGCDWLKEGAAQLNGLPSLPDTSDFKFTLPPIPRLLPAPTFQNLLVYEGGVQATQLAHNGEDHGDDDKKNHGQAVSHNGEDHGDDDKKNHGQAVSHNGEDHGDDDKKGHGQAVSHNGEDHGDDDKKGHGKAAEWSFTGVGNSVSSATSNAWLEAAAQQEEDRLLWEETFQQIEASMRKESTSTASAEAPSSVAVVAGSAAAGALAALGLALVYSVRRPRSSISPVAHATPQSSKAIVEGIPTSSNRMSS